MRGVLVDQHERVAVGREDERVVELREHAQFRDALRGGARASKANDGGAQREPRGCGAPATGGATARSQRRASRAAARSVAAIALRTPSSTAFWSRSRTSLLVGWTFGSTASAATSTNSTPYGWRPLIANVA